MGASIPSSTPFPPQEPAHARAERRALEALERERKEEADARRTVWAFVWTVFAFKIVTVLIILYVASGSGESIGMTLATTWYWFIIPGFALAGPLLYRWRLITQRRRRSQLRSAEWMVGDAGRTGADPAAATPAFDPNQIQIVIHRPDGLLPPGS
ncbi:MAG: hypothetical protein QM589_09990 [Thermomicrobiales bacterium]